MRRLSAYRVFLTRQTEYHVRNHVCFGVRDRRTGQWIETHWALNQRLAAAFPDARGKMCSVSTPLIGEPLWFAMAGGLHHTSPVLGVEERAHVQLEVAPAHASQLGPLRRPRRVSRPPHRGSLRSALLAIDPNASIRETQ